MNGTDILNETPAPDTSPESQPEAQADQAQSGVADAAEDPDAAILPLLPFFGADAVATKIEGTDIFSVRRGEEGETIVEGTIEQLQEIVAGLANPFPKETAGSPIVTDTAGYEAEPEGVTPSQPDQAPTNTGTGVTAEPENA